MRLKKENASVALKKSKLRIIKGGKDEDSFGLGDPCVPPIINHFPEEKPKSAAQISQVHDRSNKLHLNK